MTAESPGFDLSAAVKERSDAVQPFEIRVGAQVFALSPLLDVEKVTSNNGALGVIETQLGDQYPRFRETCRDEGLVLDALVLNQLIGAYFDHIGVPSPFNPDGTLNDKAVARLGEWSASKI